MEPITTPGQTRSMSVYAGPDVETDLVGTFHFGAGGVPVAFRYAPSWLAREDQFPLSPLLAPERLDAMDAEQHTMALGDFLLGLLPAGKPLSCLAADLRRRSDDIAGILATGGGLDTPGALRFGRPATPPSSDPFGTDTPREVPLNELSRRIAWRDSQSLLFWDDKVHALLPGSRDKLALHIVDERRSLVVADRMASTHIVKIGGAERTCGSLSANEVFMTRLAAGCGLPVVDMSLLRLECGPVLQIRRFDRQRRPRGNSIHRLHVISGWQLLGVAPQPAETPVDVRQAWLTALIRAVRTHAADPRAETLELLRRVAWQVLTGSHNMDPGNLAFFVEPGGRLRLAPAYALRTLWPFERADGFYPREMALPVGGDGDPSRVDAAAWAWLADEADMPADELLDLVRRLGRQLLGKLQVASRQSLAEGADRVVVERLVEGVRTICQTVVGNAGGEA